MAVAHSASSESHTGTIGSQNQTSFSWTHTQTGTPNGVLVFVYVLNNGTDTATTVRYGSVTLSRIPFSSAVDSSGEPGRTDLYFAGTGLGAGNQTITVNRVSNANIMYATAATVTADTRTNITGVVLLQNDQVLAEQNVNDGSPGTNSIRYAGINSGLDTPPSAGANSTLLQSIDIGTKTAALVRETTAGQGSRPVGFTGSTDDVAAIHCAVRELFNRTETPFVGAFTLSGRDATFTKAKDTKLTAEVSSFSLAGNAALFFKGLVVNPESGGFTLIGNPAVLTGATASELNAEIGVFNLDGRDIALTRAYTLVTTIGAFTLASNNEVSFLRTHVAQADAGTFSFIGSDADLTYEQRRRVVFVF